MNRQIFAIAALSLGLLPAAQASASNPTLQVASAVGNWIAEQGNQALREMREELQRDLERRIKPLLPTPAAPADRDVSEDQADGS